MRLILKGKASWVFGILRRMAQQERMRRICAWCQKDIGYKPGRGTTHGICEACRAVWRPR